MDHPCVFKVVSGVGHCMALDSFQRRGVLVCDMISWGASTLNTLFTGGVLDNRCT
jgi:hypothetical protein